MIYRITDFESALRARVRQEGGEICHEYCISQPTFYNWKNKYGGMTLYELYRIKELEKENARLRRIVAVQQISIDV